MVFNNTLVDPRLNDFYTSFLCIKSKDNHRNKQHFDTVVNKFLH